MAFQNKPHLNPPGADDPLITVKRLLKIVENLHRHVSPKMENRLSRVARSNGEEANETNNTNDPLRSIPLLGINPDEDLFLMLSFHLELIKNKLIKMQLLRGYVQDEISRHSIHLEKLLCELKNKFPDKCYFTKGMKKDVDDFTRKISDLLGKLSVLPDKPAGQKTLYSHDSSGYNSGRKCSYLPGLHANVEDLTKLQAFRQVKQEFRA
ncbi:unnamed protein product [Arabis nemorensis]|uniref:Uncharacterized protein n=1 Tax=Arabis nemorensis TaxID=586526 RepID=A0A565CFU8_9BRAS|nr:unnamed protein product [Arabis nemorensis]